MRDERLFGFGGKSQSASGRRRRGRRYRPSNEGLVPYRFHMVPNSADDDVFIKLETTSMRSIHRPVEKRNSSALNTKCGLLPDPWTQENPPQRPKILMNTEDAEAPKTPKVEEKTENQDSAAKGAISKFDKPPIPARPSNPLRFKTELCRAHEEGGHCRFGTACTFAHGPTELRLISRHHKYKTEPCRSYHSVGYCQYGTRCHFVHDSEDSPVVTPLDKLTSHEKSEFFGSTMNNLLESIGIKYKSPPQEKLKVNDLHGPQNLDKDERVLLVPNLAIPSPSAVDESDTFMDVVLPSPPVETSKTFMDMFLYSPTMENSKAFMDFYLPSPHVENSKTFDDLFLPSLERTTSLKTDTEDWLPEEKYQSFMDNLLEPRLHGTNKMWGKTLSSTSFSSTSEEAWCRDLDVLPRCFLPAKTSGTPSKTDFGLNSLDKFSFGDAHVSMYTAELSSAVAESVFSETPDRPLNLISALTKAFYPKS